MEKTKGQLLGAEMYDSMLDPSGSFTQYGLTKREYFAGLAMQGILANGGADFKDIHKEHIASLSVKHADALLEELSK